MIGPAAAEATTYRSLVALPQVRRLVAAAALGRMAYVMSILAIVLLVRDTSGSYAVAGTVAAAHALAGGLLAAPVSRLVDRLGHSPLLPACAALNAGAMIALLLAARAGAPTAAVAAIAALAGIAVPPLPGCMRALWPVLTGGGRKLQAAFALEAAIQEVTVILGPLAVAALVAFVSPDAAMIATATLTLVGTVAFASAPASRAQRGGRSPAGRAGALAAPGMRTLIMAFIPIGVAFGALQIVLPAFAERQGAPGAAGVLFACWGLGALVATFWYGRRRWQVSAERRYVALLMLLPLTLLALSLATSWPAMLVLMVIAGMPAGPMHATAFTLVDRVAPPHTATEAFTLARVAQVLGVAVGASLAGGLVDAAGPGRTVLAGAAIAALAAPIVVLRRRTLVAGDAQPAPGLAPARA